ncbi:IS3 family transposase [Streptomyces sp. WM6378]|uniref:IS3 family transposase n=1 Tax=Streptomyces sp. WM6378 TaxID=1415557 RepID=UPI003B63784A
MRKVHAESGKTYGAKRITAELRADGPVVNRKRIERLMRQHSIQGRMLKRRHRTTIPDPALQAVRDLLRRNFTASRPNRAWIGDITQSGAATPCREGGPPSAARVSAAIRIPPRTTPPVPCPP